MNNLIEKLREQKKMLETIIVNPPQTQEQSKVIRKAKSHLEKVDNLLIALGGNRI